MANSFCTAKSWNIIGLNCAILKIIPHSGHFSGPDLNILSIQLSHLKKITSHDKKKSKQTIYL